MSHVEGDAQFFLQAVEKMQEAKRVWAAGYAHYYSVAGVEDLIFGDGFSHLAKDVHTLQLVLLFKVIISHLVAPTTVQCELEDLF